ncbi:TonB-dependent receptor [Photobacterium sanctipauli]|uniref:TonB-dependent receptor n=1 Tax=Photobacterium sanctipauli TaxID=1342794 RepID=A0A2T3NNR0_9GAMM|nr:TonB-dependent receptor plug domain-containing protein [Photobacterium sanctipauli]PSW17621.1 TonB-dependent receptor [Photobacterium sanctipauli]
MALSFLQQKTVTIKPVSFALISSIAVIPLSAHASELDMLLAMSLEELASAEIKVTSAAKKNQVIDDIPAAVYVISSEQIKRSGVRSVAEALALAPGVQVTKISEYNWQVSLRGLNEVLYNKLLVMVDGRSVYSPLMSGTFWHTIDSMFEDIDRIEVIRGTAGTLWGGNAANGIVNIITKNSLDTLGHYGEVAVGERQYKNLNYRYGTSFSDNLTARFYVKGTQGDYYLENDDTWRNLSGGMRADYDGGNRQITVQAGGFQTKSSHDWFYANFENDPASVFTETELNVYSRGGYISFDWYEQQEDANYELHTWLDANSTNEPSAKGEFYTFDLDLLTHRLLNDNTELTLGGGVRAIHRQTEPYPDVTYQHVEPWGRYSLDPKETDTIFNAYAQLESQLTEKVSMTLGTKVEHYSLNDSTEIQPQVRVLYKHNDSHRFWAGAGRATVTPSFVATKTDAYFSGTVCLDEQCGNTRPVIIYTAANEDLDNETVVTLDMGHRYTLANHLDIDSTLFYSQHKNLRMEGNSQWHCTFGHCADGSSLPYEMFILSETYSDDLEADSYGFETAIRWTPISSFTVNTSYSYIHTEAACDTSEQCPKSNETGYKTKYNNQPAHLVSIQTLWDITPAWQLDLWYKHKSAVSSQLEAYKAPSVSTLDIRLAWQQKPSWPQVELIVDAFGKSAYEDLPYKAKIEESAFLRASWNW